MSLFCITCLVCWSQRLPCLHYCGRSSGCPHAMRLTFVFRWLSCLPRTNRRELIWTPTPVGLTSNFARKGVLPRARHIWIFQLNIKDHSLFLFVTYLRYSFGSSFVSSYTIFPSRFMCTVSTFMSACINDLGMLNLATLRCSMRLMRHVSKKASVATVAKLVSSLVIYLHCYITSVHTLTFIFLHIFFFKTINIEALSFFNSL